MYLLLMINLTMAITKQTIINSLKKIAKDKKINLSEKLFNANLKEIGIDSLVSIDLIVKIEEEFKIVLPDDILMNIKTPNDIINAVLNLVNKKK